MREVMNVVDAIRGLLPTGLAHSSAEGLAASYAQWRAQAASRLESFAITLQAGDEYQALQLAEFEPRLPDFIAQLTFPEEDQWADYCRKHGLPPPVPFDADMVQWLQKLYMRGITTSSPFYRDCLTAIADRNEERALSLIRSIVRLNPRDQDARREMERMLSAKLTPQLAALRTALELNNPKVALWWMDELDRAGAEPLLLQSKIYQAGLKLRHVMTREQSIKEIESLLAAAEARQKEENWKGAIAAIDRVQKLAKEHELTITPQQTARIGKVEKYVAQERAHVQLQEEFNVALSNLLAFVDRVSARFHNGSTPLHSEARKLEDSLMELWERAKDFRMLIPEPDAVRIHELASALKRLADFKDLEKRLTKATTVIPVLIIFFVTVGASYLYTSTQQYVRELEAAQGHSLAGTANRMISMMATSASAAIALSPGLRARVDTVRKWAGLQLKQKQETEQKLGHIEMLIGSKLDEMKPEELMAKLQEASNEVRQLSTDYLRGPREQLERLQATAQVRLKALQQQDTEKARKQVRELEQVAVQLDFSTPPEGLANRLTTLQDGLKKIASYEHPTIPELRLSDELEASIKQLRDKTESYTKEMAALEEDKKAMMAADELEEYHGALKQYSKLRFTKVRHAEPMLAAFPTSDEVGAKLFFEGNPEAWETARQQTKGNYSFYPEEAAAEEVKALTALRNDPLLNAPGPVKKMMEALRLQHIIDASNGRCKMPLICAIDSVVRFPQGDPIVKAYLVKCLYTIMQPRQVSWGLHYCPELAASITKLDGMLDTIPLRSGDWKRPNIQQKYAAKLKFFFDSTAAHKSFHDLAVSYQNIVGQVMNLGVNYAGYVDDAQAAHVRIKGYTPSEIWGISEQSGGPIPVTFAAGAARRDDLIPLRKWSPLFIIPMNLRQAVALHLAN